jgi:hypothetical protein
VQRAAADVAEAQSRDARRMARLWRLLAAAKGAGCRRVERVRLILDHRDSREVSAWHVIRLLERKEPPRDAPVILLDADADPVITETVYPGARITGIRVRPNAHVVQIHDATISKTALENPRQRERWRWVIRMEVLRDRLAGGGGVLVGASRAVVQLFFEDARHRFEGMAQDEVSRFMLGTELHGARWLWFGGRALGSNTRDCTAAVVIGREELPLDVLEDQGRALFGDGEGAPLEFVEIDERGRPHMPQELVSYRLADGGALGAAAGPMVRA